MNALYRGVRGVARMALILGLAASAFAHADAKPTLGLVINEDNSHFFGSRAADAMTLDGLHAFVDQYADTTVSHLFLCPNSMRASFRSATRDAIWDENTQTMPSGDDHGGRWVRNARLLHERGLDPYAVWIARCREKGISPWLSMRMNDVHDVQDEASFMHSAFWVKHPEYWRVPGSQSGSWVDRALDYGHAEVRAHAMSFIRELLERYDPDGLELDWMRFGYHFAPGREEEGAEILTGFMREVRALTQEWSTRRGHAIALGARVPTDPDAARGLGMDGARWVREGLVDMLVPAPFWTTSDFDIPAERWREQMGEAGKRIVLATGLEYNIRAYPGGQAVANGLETVYGFAAAMFHRGVDQIYLFNFMDSETIPVSGSDYRILIEKGLDSAYVAGMPRRHVAAFRDTVPPGFSSGAQLPINTRDGGAVRLYTGPVPERGLAVFILGLGGDAAQSGDAAAAFEVLVNGGACAPLEDDPHPDRFPGVSRAMRFECFIKALHPGDNIFTIKQINDAPGKQVVWAELRIEPAE